MRELADQAAVFHAQAGQRAALGGAGALAGAGDQGQGLAAVGMADGDAERVGRVGAGQGTSTARSGPLAGLRMKNGRLVG